MTRRILGMVLCAVILGVITYSQDKTSKKEFSSQKRHPKSFKVFVTGVILDEDKSPIVGERLWIGGYLDGFEVSVDTSGNILNPFGDTDSIGRFNIKIQSDFTIDRKEFTICTGSPGVGFFRWLEILKRNGDPIVFAIDGKRSKIDLGDITYTKK
jgi:hypothetical protein